MGTFFKQIYRYTHSRRYRHNENLWPYVKITRAAEGHIDSLTLRGQPVPIVNLSEIKDSYSGPLMLIASGPSVNETDFTPLKHLPAMGVNGSWFLANETHFKFFVIVDMTFIDQRQAMVKEMVNDPQIMFFTTVRGVVKVMEMFGAAAVRCQIAIIEDACFKTFQPQVYKDEVYQVYQHQPDVSFSEENKNIAFFQDIRKGLFDAETVAHWALQIINYLGFSKIVIAGLDMNNFQKPRFYESENDISPCSLESEFDSLIKPAFQHASQVLASNHIEALNLSLNSALDSKIFKKAFPHEVQ